MVCFKNCLKILERIYLEREKNPVFFDKEYPNLSFLIRRVEGLA
jgi:hypothetical protein